MTIISELITWCMLALILENVIDINGAPCPYQGTHTPCVCAHKDGHENGTCWSWARKPYFARPAGKTIGLKALKIKEMDLTRKREPKFMKQGYCKLAQPGPMHTVPLVRVAGKNLTTKVDQIYAHPRYGLVGVKHHHACKGSFWTRRNVSKQLSTIRTGVSLFCRNQRSNIQWVDKNIR